MRPSEKVLIPPHLTRGKGLRGVGVWEGGGRGWKVDWLRLPHVEGLLGTRLRGAEEARRWREEREPLAWKALEEVGHLLLPEQREDAAKSLQAFFRSLEGGPAGFVLANGTGTGKTYVYGAFLRAVEAFGLEGLVVLPNSDLAHQTKGVLRLMGVRAETTTYAKLRPEEAGGKVLVLDEAHLAKNHRASDRGRRAWSAVVNGVFTLFSSATPFDRPWEAQYLFGPTRAAAVWGYRSHYELLEGFGVVLVEHPNGGSEFRFVGEVEDLLRFHAFLKEKGFLTRRLFRPPEGLVEYEVSMVDLPREERAVLSEVRRRLLEATRGVGPGERGLIMAQRAVLSRALLERFKLRAFFPTLERLLAEGWHVALFVQYRGEKALDLSTLEAVDRFIAEGDERQLKGLHVHLATALAGLSLHLPSPVEMVRERFSHLGEALAFYTGGESEKQLRRTKERWDRGEVRLLVATAAKGGTGLSLHDTRGGRPTAQVVLTLPWTASQLDQILGRVVRVGVKSPVKILFPAAKVAVERKMAEVLAASLRILGYAVRGGEMPVPEHVVQAFLADLANVDEERFMRLVAQGEEEEEEEEKDPFVVSFQPRRRRGERTPLFAWDEEEG